MTTLKHFKLTLFVVALIVVTRLLAYCPCCYRCPRCGLILQYDKPPGQPKCPTDGAAMVPTQCPKGNG